MPFWLECLLPVLIGGLAGEAVYATLWAITHHRRPTPYVDPGHPDRAAGGGW